MSGLFWTIGPPLFLLVVLFVIRRADAKSREVIVPPGQFQTAPPPAAQGFQPIPVEPRNPVMPVEPVRTAPPVRPSFVADRGSPTANPPEVVWQNIQRAMALGYPSGISMSPDLQHIAYVLPIAPGPNVPPGTEIHVLATVIEGYQVPIEHPEWALRDDWEPTPENPNVTILNTTERVALEVWLNVPGMEPQKADRNFSLDTPHETPMFMGRAARAPYVVQAFNEIVHKANSRYGGQSDPWAHLR